eukprot:8105491-Pyramimonas_sp.AAC.1
MSEAGAAFAASPGACDQTGKPRFRRASPTALLCTPHVGWKRHAIGTFLWVVVEGALYFLLDP